MTADEGKFRSGPVQCPECVQGKHGNCDGDAFDPEADHVVPCDCPCIGKAYREAALHQLTEAKSSNPGPLDLTGIRARAHAATGGRWHYRDGEVVVASNWPVVGLEDGEDGEGYNTRDLVLEPVDGEHIAGMDPATTLALLDSLEAAKAEVDRLRALEDKTPTQEGTWSTPGQLWHHLLEANAAKRWSRLTSLIDAFQQAESEHRRDVTKVGR